jgi:broad specificity phosphatase PhoE
MLRDERIDRAFSSDLSRARETAEIVLAPHDGVPLAFDARLREMRFGAWEGLVWSEIVERQPELAERSSAAPRFYTPPGGESFDELCARIEAALFAIDASVVDGETVLVATHAGPLHALLKVALGGSEAEALGVKFAPASTTRIAFDTAGAHIVELNRTAPRTAPR